MPVAQLGFGRGCGGALSGCIFGVFQRPARLIAVLAALAGTAAGCAMGGAGEYLLKPVSGGDAEAAQHQSGVRAAARYLDPQSMEAYVRAQGLDLLASRLKDMRVTAFALTMENGGTQSVSFDPRGIRLSAGGPETFSPLEYTHLYMALPEGESRREALLRLPQLLFEGVQDLKPGRVVERMVLFRRPEKLARTGVLLVGGIYVKGVPLSLALEFTAERVN